MEMDRDLKSQRACWDSKSSGVDIFPNAALMASSQVETALTKTVLFPSMMASRAERFNRLLFSKHQMTT